MFVKYFYQPFFNILVGIYWLLGQISPSLADMGIAVILFSLVIRILLFPLTLLGERSEEEKHQIMMQIKDIQRQYAHDPVKQKELIRQVMHKNKRVVFSTTFNLIVQGSIVLMLYRIFTTGLEGRDFHLLYSFMPHVNHVNLMFLGKYDLSRPNPHLNLLQSVMIFIVELLLALRSPNPLERKHVWLMQLVLPVGSYIAFMFLPAGKKLFIITSLMFSAVYHTFRLAQEQFHRFALQFQQNQSQSESSTPQSQPLPS